MMWAWIKQWAADLWGPVWDDRHDYVWSQPKKKCCCGDPRSQTETMGGCGNCFLGACRNCEAPVWVDHRGIVVKRTVEPLG